MNASASVLAHSSMQSGSVARAEHISIEAETDYSAPTRPPHRKVLSKYALSSSLRKCSTELALLDEHYLQVCATRAKRETCKYSIDLRFLNSQPVRSRHVAWVWFAATALLVAAAGAGISLAITASGSMLVHPGFIAGCLTLVGALATAFIGVRGTSESLNFTSIHGGATLVNVVGGIGSTKQGKAFFVAMIKDIAAAKAARPQQKPQWLRDEMREHHRLRELGVLSESEYEASKVRILKAHA